MAAEIMIIMGVSGSGKSTLGRQVAESLSAVFLDADDFHDEQAIDLMRAGTPLTDAQRVPWLKRLTDVLRSHMLLKHRVVLACSALKAAHREMLRQASNKTAFVYLHGERALLLERLSARQGHFFNVALLDSQLYSLEPPTQSTAVLTLSIKQGTELQLTRAVAFFEQVYA